MSRRTRRSKVPSTQHIKEQVDPTYMASSPTQEDWYWSRAINGAEEDYYWRRLSDNFYQKDLIPSTYLEIHNQVYEAYNANPLAFAIIELTTSFVLGEGVTISANNKRVQQVINTFWDNPENRMDERVYSLCTELALYGEQFIHFFVNKYDGSVIIRQIDPSLIDQIETDPQDVEKHIQYHRRPIGQTMSATSGDPPGVEISGKEIDNQGTWFEAGSEVCHVAINKVSNAKRGKSDLATLLPWLRRYKDWLTDRVRINKFKTAFMWDVCLTGADKKTIDRKKMEYSNAPEPGSVLIHGEGEKWSAVEPKIAGADASSDGRAIKLMVAVGASLPEHYLSDGDNGNRATAGAMSLPTLLKFKRRQRIIRYMLTIIIDRVISEAQRVGKIGPRVDTSYNVLFPEIDSGEHGTLAHAASTIVSALTAAKAQGWVSDETAMKMLFEYCGEEIDIHEEREKITKQSTPTPNLNDLSGLQAKYPSLTKTNKPDGPVAKSPIRQMDGNGKRGDQTDDGRI